MRSLYGDYAGPLYAVKRTADGAVKDIGPATPGGYADSAAQDAFCGGGACVIWMIYDQTKRQNHLSIAPRKDGAHHIRDKPCNATRDRLTVGGHPVYAAYFEGGMGYRADNTSGVAVHDEAETMYMVTSGVHYNNRCCFDYGNAETNNLDDGAGTMEAIYFGNDTGGLDHGGAGKGPWIMADMENALWGADVVQSNETLINHTFVTAMVKGDVSTNGPPAKPEPYRPGVGFSGGNVAPCGRLDTTGSSPPVRELCLGPPTPPTPT